MHIVVTGSSGFVGGHVVEALAHRGAAVTGVDRRPPLRPTAADAVVVGDLSRPDPATARALRGADAVVHLAGCPGVRDVGPDAGRRRYRDNVVALREVLRLLPDDVPVVAVSSSSVYGGVQGGATRGSREDDALAPRGGYARSKVLAEAVCRRAAAGRPAAITVVRPFTVVGDGQRPDMALHRWVSAALRGDPLTVLGSPERTRDVTDVRDVAAALADLVHLAPGGAVNVGTGHAVTLRAMVEAVGAATGTRPALRVLPAAPDEAPDTLADVTRLVGLTGRRPATDLADVVARVRDDVLAGTALTGTALTGTALDGTALTGTALTAVAAG